VKHQASHILSLFYNLIAFTKPLSEQSGGGFVVVRPISKPTRFSALERRHRAPSLKQDFSVKSNIRKFIEGL
jgi:hypothetical protein